MVALVYGSFLHKLRPAALVLALFPLSGHFQWVFGLWWVSGSILGFYTPGVVSPVSWTEVGWFLGWGMRTIFSEGLLFCWPSWQMCMPKENDYRASVDIMAINDIIIWLWLHCIYTVLVGVYLNILQNFWYKIQSVSNHGLITRVRGSQQWIYLTDWLASLCAPGIGAQRSLL